MMKLLSLVLFSFALGCAAPVVAASEKKEHCAKDKGACHKKGLKKKLTSEEQAARKAAARARVEAARQAKQGRRDAAAAEKAKA